MEKKEMKKISRKMTVLIILLSVLLVLLLAVGLVVYRYYSALAGFYKGATQSSEAVQSQKAENDKKAQDLLNDLVPEVTYRDLTDEERAMLESGLLSEEDALALIRGETLAPAVTAAEPVETTEPAETTAEPVETTSAPVTTAKPAETTAAETTVNASARQEEIIAEIYLLRATYLNEIDKLIKDTKQMYIDLPKEEKTLANKMKIVEKMIPKGNKLEDDCDARMEELLSELTGILQQQGASTAIVDEIRATYNEQKELKLAELYQQYGSKLEK